MWPTVSQCNWTQEFDLRVVGVLMPRLVMSDEQRWGRQREPSTLEPKEQGFSPACRTSAMTVSTRVPRPHTHCGSCGLFFRSRLLSCNTPDTESSLYIAPRLLWKPDFPRIKPVTWLFHRIPEQSSHARGYNEISRICRVMKRPFLKKIKVFHDSSVFSYMKILGI